VIGVLLIIIEFEWPDGESGDHPKVKDSPLPQMYFLTMSG